MFVAPGANQVTAPGMSYILCLPYNIWLIDWLIGWSIDWLIDWLVAEPAAAAANSVEENDGETKTFWTWYMSDLVLGPVVQYHN